MSVFWYQVYQARLRERLLTSRGLQSNLTSVLEAESGKLDIKSRKPGILLISLPSWFTLQTSKYDVTIDFCVIQHHWRHHSKSATSSWPDKGTCREKDKIYQATCSATVLWTVTDKWPYWCFKVNENHCKLSLGSLPYFRRTDSLSLQL